MEGLLELISSITTGYALAIFAMFISIYLIIISKFRHYREFFKIKDIIRSSQKENTKGIKPLQSLAMSLGAHVGIGNIVGVGYAISFGGPGAIFWMWVTAIIGSVLSYFESMLAGIYKKKIDGEYRGGPAFYTKGGLNSKKLGLFIAIVMLLSVGFFWTGLQSNAMANAFSNAFGVSAVIVAIIVVIVVGAVIYGGAKSIAKVAEKIVPIMAISYVVLAFIILFFNIENLPSAFKLIFEGAFSRKAIAGGFLGETIIWGIKRGFYSNEAGMGTSPHFVGSVDTEKIKNQAVIQMLSVFIDTLVICTLTALMIIATNSYNIIDKNGEMIVANKPNILAGIENTVTAVESVFPHIGSAIIAIMLAFFAITTLISLYHIAETNLAFLKDNSRNKKRGYSKNKSFKLFFLISIFIATISNTTSILHLTDIGLGINAWINLSVILLLQDKVIKKCK